MKLLTLCLNTKTNRHSEWPDNNHTILFFPGSLIRIQVCHKVLIGNVCYVHNHGSSSQCMGCIVYVDCMFPALTTECL
jgi:hypothetical protein